MKLHWAAAASLAACIFSSVAPLQAAASAPQDPTAEAASAPKAFEPTNWLDTAAPVDQCIAFALYTVQAGTLKMTAQLYPLADGVEREVLLFVRPRAGGAQADGASEWRSVASVAVDETLYGHPQKNVKRWLAHFRVAGWDSARDFEYRVEAAGGRARFEGVVRRDPIEKNVVSVASLSCNGNYDRGPRADIVRNLRYQDPDLLFFAGDQSYDHKRHYEAWLLWGRQFREVTRDRPTITIPDDHDIGQGNVWGASGQKADNGAGDSGGYHWSASYVNAVQAAQTWHLPDPADATPVQRGIGVYYTSMRLGGLGFAILEDRKFKTGPRGLIAGHKGRSDHYPDPAFDTRRLDVPEAVLLGERQLRFLDDWAQDWTGVELKAVLSQTVFANAAHLHGPGIWGKTAADDLRDKPGQRLHADLDSNGWPQTGRNRALQAIRRGFATMLAGDQHLATLVHHGVNDFGDSGVSFVSPSIVNYYVRRWAPLEASQNALQGSPLPMCGDYLDGFQNKITMLAYVNPDPDRVFSSGTSGQVWGPRAEGYGLVYFDKAARTMRYEVWPRGVDAAAPGAKPYKGFPVTKTQADQYGRAARAWLPELVISGLEHPVVQVIEERSASVVYTMRIRGTRFRPKVFVPGDYTVRVSGQPGPSRTISGLRAAPSPVGELVVDF
ncbi:MAG: alkaline phosphatase D family protein [Planctomycetota bacterium]